jgi:hypothetical protein
MKKKVSTPVLEDYCTPNDEQQALQHIPNEEEQYIIDHRVVMADGHLALDRMTDLYCVGIKIEGMDEVITAWFAGKTQATHFKQWLDATCKPYNGDVITVYQRITKDQVGRCYERCDATQRLDMNSDNMQDHVSHLLGRAKDNLYFILTGLKAKLAVGCISELEFCEQVTTEVLLAQQRYERR